jgi:hypothetical protein
MKGELVAGIFPYFFPKKTVTFNFELRVRVSVHHSITHTENPTEATVYQNFISYLYEAQHVSGDTPSIIRSLKLHWQPLVYHTWNVVGRVAGGRWNNVHERCVARNMLKFIYIWNNKILIHCCFLLDFSLRIVL